MTWIDTKLLFWIPQAKVLSQKAWPALTRRLSSLSSANASQLLEEQGLAERAATSGSCKVEVVPTCLLVELYII